VLPAISCQTATTLVPGIYPVMSTYSGDGNYTGTAATGASFTVTKAATPLNESASPATIVFGSTDTVSASGLSAGATGTVTFTSGTTTLCTATLPATSCQTSATLTPAVYPVTATYSGDTNNSPATATGAQFAVIKADTTMTVHVSPTETVRGAPVTLWVTGLPPSATGTVTFSSGNVVLCTVTLPATSCTPTINLPPGSYPVTATYSGNSNYNGTNALNSGVLGVLAAGANPSVPATGGVPDSRRTFLGALLVAAGAASLVISRRWWGNHTTV
jgi:hypothetical protein